MIRALVLIVISCLVFGTAVAQVMVYGTNGHHFTEPVLKLDNNRTMPPFSFNIGEAYYTIVGNKIMEGPMGSEFDLLYTFIDGKIYSGHAMYSSQIKYTFLDGKVYRGDSVFQLDIICNVRDNVIYNGINSMPPDALYFIEGQVSTTQLFGILLSLGLIS